MDALCSGIILLVIGGFAKVIYDYRRSIFIWFKRKKLQIFPVNFDIVFSIEFREGLNSGEYFKEIKKNFIENLERVGLNKKIRLRDFSDVKKFQNQEEVENFVKEKEIDLIIWGDFLNDVLKTNGKSDNKLNLKFTYCHPDNKEKKVAPILLLDISSKLAIKNYWKITEDDSLHDVEIVSNNLFDIATYIVGVTLKLFGQIERSIEVFESLRKKLLIGRDSFVEQIIPHLLNCYYLIVMNAIFQPRKYILARETCKKILILKQNDHFGLSNLAFFQYKTGEKFESKNCVELLLKLYPRDPVTELDVAFFRILQKDYKNAFKHYGRFIQFSIANEVNIEPQQVVDFLGEEYKSSKEPALLYGSGIISMHLGDKELAENDFTIFLLKFKEETCKQMYRDAERRLAILKKKNLLN